MTENINDISNKDLLLSVTKLIVEENQKNRLELKEEIKGESERIFCKLQNLHKRIEDLQSKYIALENRCERLEKQSRKNNIIIFGLDVTESAPILETTLTELSQLLGIPFVEADINNIFRLKSEKTPTIKIEFATYLKKQKVFENIHKLRGKKIFINHDLSVEERKERKILIEHQREAKSNNLQAVIKGKTLIINNETFTIKQLENLQSSNSNLTNLQSSTYDHSLPKTPKTLTPQNIVIEKEENIGKIQVVDEITRRIIGNLEKIDKKLYSPPAEKKKTRTHTIPTSSPKNLRKQKL